MNTFTASSSENDTTSTDTEEASGFTNEAIENVEEELHADIEIDEEDDDRTDDE